AGVAGVVVDPRRNPDQVAGGEVDGALAVAVVALARQDVEELLAVGVVVERVLLAREDGDQAKRLLRQGDDPVVADPAEATPRCGHGFSLSAADDGYWLVGHSCSLDDQHVPEFS